MPGPTVNTLAAAEDLAVGMYYCGSRMAVQQWRAVKRLSLVVCKYTARWISPKHTPSSGVQSWCSRLVYCTHPATEV